MSRHWTRWTATLAWGEALTDWAWSQDSEVDWQSRDRAGVMVLLAVAIGDAIVENRLVTPLTIADASAGRDISDPDDFGRLPIAAVRKYFGDVEQAKVLVAQRMPHGGPLIVGPYGGQPGFDEYSWVTRIKDSDQAAWRRVHDGAVQVLDRHINAAGTPAPVLADRKPALVEMERAKLHAQLDEALGEEY